MIAALSGYRPPAELAAVARKEVPLPFQARMSKPSYYGYAEDNVSQEILWAARDVDLLAHQRLVLVLATVGLAGLCAWIINWE